MGSFKCAGMSRPWKLFNLIIVWLPKSLIWYRLASVGYLFLMETSGILDVTINAMALTFVLNIDELILTTLTTNATQYIMQNVEDYILYDASEEENMTESEILQRFEDEEVWQGYYPGRQLLCLLMPKRLLGIFVLMFMFLFRYYFIHCTVGEGGNLISKAVHYPKSVAATIADFLMGRPMD